MEGGGGGGGGGWGCWLKALLAVGVQNVIFVGKTFPSYSIRVESFTVWTINVSTRKTLWCQERDFCRDTRVAVKPKECFTAWATVHPL